MSDSCNKCGAPATYGPPPRCAKCVLGDLDRMLANCDPNTSLRWRLEQARADLLTKAPQRAPAQEPGS